MIASPLTTSPRSSTARQRSASPSNAMPPTAPRSWTTAASASRCVDPTPALMLRPSGSMPISCAAGKTAGATGTAAPFAQSTTSPAWAGEPKVSRSHAAYSGHGAGDGLGPAALALVAAAHRRLDLGLPLVGQLAPVAADELDAVVPVRVVRRRDDAAQRRARQPGQHRHARRRDDAGRAGDAAGRDDALDQRGLEPGAGLARVAADHDRRARARRRAQRRRPARAPARRSGRRPRCRGRHRCQTACGCGSG